MTSKLYVGNLAFQTTEDTLRQAFAPAGEVSEVSLVLDRMTGRSRGFAFLVMGSEEAAKKAIELMNGQLLDGRPLRVNEAEDRRSGGGGGYGAAAPGSGAGGRGGRGGRGGGRGGGGYGAGGGGDW